MKNYVHCCSVWLYQTEIRANLFGEIGTELVNSCVLRVGVKCLFCVCVYNTHMYIYVHIYTYIHMYTDT
jgi:hypothetical protein